MLFFKPKSGVEWIIAGLGNPGKKYEGTRHNAGFDALDSAAKEWGIDVRRVRFNALCGQGSASGHSVLLLKPQTYMNLSGNSLQQAASFYKTPSQNIIVLSDDINLAPGTLRIRKNGSAGGHNGLKDIIAALGDDFPRIRIGVGERPSQEQDNLAEWVTGRFSQQDRKCMEQRFGDIAKAMELIMDGRLDQAMAQYNGEGRK